MILVKDGVSILAQIWILLSARLLGSATFNKFDLSWYFCYTLDLYSMDSTCGSYDSILFFSEELFFSCKVGGSASRAEISLAV